MERLRRHQQAYEQDLLAKGVIPHTTEEAVRRQAERQQTLLVIDSTPTDRTNPVK